MKALFISDAHLRSPQDDNYRLLLDLLSQQQDLDGLFLLGDIFEFWFGYQHLVFAAYVPILERLHQLSQQGTKLYFVEGNHDFLLGPYFRDTLSCQIISEHQTIEWDDRRIHLCHGDLIHPTPGYLKLRKFWRSWFMRQLARIIHPDLAWKFGLWLSDKSQQKRPLRKQSDPTRWLRDYSQQPAVKDCDLLVCGHFHYPVSVNHQQPKMIALGDWQSRQCYLLMENGNIQLKHYPG